MKLLKECLGPSFAGGPSISFEDGEFVLYEWYDQPSGSMVLVKDPDWETFLEKDEAYHNRKG